MYEMETDGASTRRVMRQAGEVLNRELDVLYADRRQNEATIAALQTNVDLFDTEKSTLESINRDLEGQIIRDRARMSQEGWILDFTIQFAIVGWIGTFLGIGYAVWVG